MFYTRTGSAAGVAWCDDPRFESMAALETFDTPMAGFTYVGNRRRDADDCGRLLAQGRIRLADVDPAPGTVDYGADRGAGTPTTGRATIPRSADPQRTRSRSAQPCSPTRPTAGPCTRPAGSHSTVPPCAGNDRPESGSRTSGNVARSYIKEGPARSYI